MRRSLFALIAVAAFIFAGGTALADGHEEAKGKGKAAAEKTKEKGKKHKGKAEEGAGKAKSDADDAQADAEESAREAAEDATEADESAREAAEEAAEGADEAAEQVEVDSDDAANAESAKRDVPPGMAKRDEHPSTGKGSDKGQEARAKTKKPWWSFWD